ncbi:hypothetical protein KAR34_05785 [bacterium]|nr:hypothetical protein [bacterium]
MRFLINALFISCVILLPLEVIAEEIRPDQYPVKSYKYLEFGEFNQRIKLAVDEKEAWVKSPLLVSQRFVDISKEEPGFISIIKKDNASENPTESIVTIVLEGFLDDSQRGAWYQIYLKRDPPKSCWLIKKVETAYLCWRGKKNIFKKELCP